MSILHVDPAGAGAIGVARVMEDGSAALRSILTLKKSDGTQQRTWVERLRPVLEQLADGVTVLGVELPPAHAKKDTGTAGARGTIGLSIGRVIGMVEAWGYDRGLDVRVVSVSSWQHWRDRQIALRRVVVPSVISNPFDGSECRLRMSAPQAGGTVLQRWACGMERRVKVASLGRMSSGCPRCSSGRETRAGDERSLQHKVSSFSLAARLWPDEVQRLVVESATRARDIDPAKEPWRLIGVVDACEAGLQGAALLDTTAAA